MTHFVNLRGCNGSGKTTILRNLVQLDGLYAICDVYQPHYPEGHEKAGKLRGRPIPATITKSGYAIVGDYRPGVTGTTAGLDRISTQADAKAAILAAGTVPGVRAVLFEGIIVSTIFQGWLDFSDALGKPMTWAFFDTPVEECLTRVQQRNGGKPINEELVWDKWRSIERVKEKVRMAGQPCVIIPQDGLAEQAKFLINLLETM